MQSFVASSLPRLCSSELLETKTAFDVFGVIFKITLLVATYMKAFAHGLSKSRTTSTSLSDLQHLYILPSKKACVCGHSYGVRIPRNLSWFRISIENKNRSLLDRITGGGHGETQGLSGIAFNSGSVTSNPHALATIPYKSTPASFQAWEDYEYQLSIRSLG